MMSGPMATNLNEYKQSMNEAFPLVSLNIGRKQSQSKR